MILHSISYSVFIYYLQKEDISYIQLNCNYVIIGYIDNTVLNTLNLFQSYIIEETNDSNIFNQYDLYNLFKKVYGL